MTLSLLYYWIKCLWECKRANVKYCATGSQGSAWPWIVGPGDWQCPLQRWGIQVHTYDQIHDSTVPSEMLRSDLFWKMKNNQVSSTMNSTDYAEDVTSWKTQLSPHVGPCPELGCHAQGGLNLAFFTCLVFYILLMQCTKFSFLHLFGLQYFTDLL